MSVRIGAPETTSPVCLGCGNESVSPQFGRVFGDREDNVHACKDCATSEELTSGAAAGLDVDMRRVGGGHGGN